MTTRREPLGRTTAHHVAIASIGAYAPPGIMTNFDLEKMVDTSDEWIRTRSGISTRHIAGEDCATSDIALPAARLALERAQLAPEDLDLIVMATITPDYPLPATACVMQHRLGALKAAAFDISASCTGFIYALYAAYAPLALGHHRNALVIAAETLSKFTDFQDRSTCVLLGDGAGAVVLKPTDDDRGFASFYLRADGGGLEHLYVPAGGSRRPASHESVQQREHFIRMNGNEVFKFAVRVMDEAVITALERAGATADEVAMVIPHQANIRIIEAAAKRLGIPMERWACNIQEYGNTSSASIPLALNEAYEQGRLQAGDLIVLVGFGAGLTWGAVALRW